MIADSQGILGRLAQLVEHLPYKQVVTGSSPVPPTMNPFQLPHMKHCSKESVIAQLSQNNALVNGFLTRTVAQAVGFYRWTIEDADTLYSLIWHYHKSSQILTPGHWFGGKLYTVGDVAKYMINQGYTFEGLANRAYKGTYDPNWFKACASIDANLDWSKYDTFVVQPSNNAERRDCPHGTFRLIDGVHRSLTYAVKLLRNEIQFKPVDAILVLPK